ncbi:hypothetical protein FACS1894102_1710 [Spirochaetia bacterium]|nr:hypothetical protein FACS1894102_1710 [Spirochaetia bacterium]
MEKEKFVLLLSMILCLAGSVSLFAADKFFEVSSEPTGADVVVYDKDKNIVQTITTPAKISLNGKLPFNVKVTMNDYISQTFEVKKAGTKHIILEQTPEALARPVLVPERDFEVTVTEDGKGAAIVKYKGTGINIIVPDKIEGFPVMAIYPTAFEKNTKISSVILPDTITHIFSNYQHAAFLGCTSLKSVILPKNLTVIDDFMFSDCTALTSITIPNSVTSIGNRAFGGTGLTSIIIPNSVTSIGSGAFGSCRGLTSVTISNSVPSIGSQTFYGCKSLTSITIPKNITAIWNSAFENCTSLTKVEFVGDTQIEFGLDVFTNCPFNLAVKSEITKHGYDKEF